MENKNRIFREENILSLFKELSDADQKSIYHTIWSLSAKDLLIKINKNDGREH